MDKLHPKGFLPRTIPKMGGLKAQLKSRPLFDGPLSEVANLQRHPFNGCRGTVPMEALFISGPT
jgi:hypothetical protein